MQVVEYDGRIELIPEKDIKELRGFLKGINTSFEREKDRTRILEIHQPGSLISLMNLKRYTLLIH